MLTVFFYSLPFLFTVGVAFGVAVLGFLQYRLAARVLPETRVMAAVLIIGIGALLSVVLTSRTLDETKISTGLIVTYDDYAGGFAASRWLSLLLIGASLIEIARGWVRGRAIQLPDPAQPILFALLAYYLGTIAIQGVASDVPGFSFRSLYVPLVLVAGYYQQPKTLKPILSAARWALFALLAGSLLAIWLRPDFVMHQPDPGSIPGINWRLFGLTPHANTLGPIALLAIVIELHAPWQWNLMRWANLLCAAAVLLLAQSKTAWAAALALMAVVYLPLALRRAVNVTGPSSRFNRTVWILLGSLVLMCLFVGTFVAFDVFEFIQRRGDLASLTGRTNIWEITLQAWEQNKLFGYGPEIWGPERQLRFHMFHVGHAHNQAVQTLGEAGLVGLWLLLAYVGTLLLSALRIFVASRGFVLLLLLLMLVRCVTEAPMRGEGLLSWATFLHLLLLVVACHYVRGTGPRAMVGLLTRPASVRGGPGAGHDMRLASREC